MPFGNSQVRSEKELLMFEGEKKASKCLHFSFNEHIFINIRQLTSLCRCYENKNEKSSVYIFLERIAHLLRISFSQENVSKFSPASGTVEQVASCYCLSFWSTFYRSSLLRPLLWRGIDLIEWCFTGRRETKTKVIDFSSSIARTVKRNDYVGQSLYEQVISKRIVSQGKCFKPMHGQGQENAPWYGKIGWEKVGKMLKNVWAMQSPNNY